jgi:hypothetical protein
MEALARFHVDVSWTGTIAEGAMGLGTPAMTAVGRGQHERIQDGRWIVGSYEQEQYLLDGSFVLKWQLHWVAGWDPASGEYRATTACRIPSQARDVSARIATRDHSPSAAPE